MLIAGAMGGLLSCFVWIAPDTIMARVQSGNLDSSITFPIILHESMMMIDYLSSLIDLFYNN